MSLSITTNDLEELLLKLKFEGDDENPKARVSLATSGISGFKILVPSRISESLATLHLVPLFARQTISNFFSPLLEHLLLYFPSLLEIKG
jgi:hypothetical protein